jgi:hypothetical protein
LGITRDGEGMSDEGEPLSADEELAAVIRENVRAVQTYWYWKDKPVGERGAAHDVLTEAGMTVKGLRSCDQDPPDCEAMVDGLWTGIEFTELTHRKALERSLKGERQYFTWPREALLSELQRWIDRKDTANLKGGPYERYILVIVTDEYLPDRETVRTHLEGATFRVSMITDVLLRLSFHPSTEPEGGHCPVCRLPLERPISS